MAQAEKELRVRVPAALIRRLQKIAKHEERSTPKVVARLLSESCDAYERDTLPAR